MTKLLYTAVAGACLAAAACMPDKSVAPSPGNQSPRALALYAKAIRSMERALATAEAHRSRAQKRFQPAYDQDIRQLTRKLAEFRRASGISTSTLDPSLYLDDGDDGRTEQAGIIDPYNTWTRVYPRGSAIISVQTVTTWPASSITHNTSGTIKTRGRDYPINANWSDFGWDAYQTIPLTAVDCSTAGATITASTYHLATWNVRDAKASLQGHSTYGNDNGECPPVGPTARFTMYGGGNQSGPGNHLTIPVPSGGSATVTLDASEAVSDAPIASYSWYVNGAFVGRGPSISYTVSQEHVGITLVVRDQNGKTSTAEGSVHLQYPPEENCDGGGGGNETWRVAAGSSRSIPAVTAADCSAPGGGSTFETIGGETWLYDVEVWLVCIRHDFNVSFDGGQSYKFSYSTYRNCRIEYRF